MNNESKIFPINHPPMSEEEFQARLYGQLQDLTLHDGEELRKMAEHKRQMERTAQKSSLHMEEHREKYFLKAAGSKIEAKNNRVYLQFSGSNYCFREGIVLFRCEIEQVLHYQYFDSGECYFQIVLLEGDTGNRKVTKLYPAKMLSAISKLKQTVLSKYDDAPSGKASKEAWEWIYKRVVALYESAALVVIPERPGWFRHVNHYRFYSGADENAWMLADQIKKFKLERFCEQDINSVVKKLISNILDAADVRIGVLLIFRFSALLSRLATEESFPMGITLIGEKSERVAREFLCVLGNDVDTVNIDTDRVGVIRMKAIGLQDTPIIFLSSNPDSKSTQNRVQNVSSWMETGFVEGVKIKIPFVFCLQRFSQHYPLDRTIVLDTDDFKFPDEKRPFAKLQSAVVSLVEKSGEYWVRELQRYYGHFSKLREKGETGFPLFSAVESAVLAMLKNQLESDTYESFRCILTAGKDEIIHQQSLRKGVLADVFHKAVVRFVDANRFFVTDRNHVRQIEQSIFYDTSCYYFTQDVFNVICRTAGIDEKSRLYIKQKLCEMEVVKLYRNTGSHSREFQIDFRVTMKDGRTKDLSGLAIFRKFWDEIGGIGLFERGSGANA